MLTFIIITIHAVMLMLTVQDKTSRIIVKPLILNVIFELKANISVPRYWVFVQFPIEHIHI